MPRMHAKGFTLIEMSVVIVIIGLLVGGIVAGRNYVKNAELNGLVNEAKFYINAFGQFQQQYGTVPGDYPQAANTWAGAFSGDGNGQILSSNDANSGSMPEIFYAFQHLNRAGLIDGSYTGATTCSGTGSLCARAGVNVPRSVFSGAAYLFDHPPYLDGSVINDGFYYNGLYFHVMRVAGTEANASGPPAAPILTPAQALSIDTKYDDGRPGMGWIMTPKKTAAPNCSTSDTVTDTVYNTTNKAAACILILKVQ